ETRLRPAAGIAKISLVHARRAVHHDLHGDALGLHPGLLIGPLRAADREDEQKHRDGAKGGQQAAEANAERAGAGFESFETRIANGRSPFVSEPRPPDKTDQRRGQEKPRVVEAEAHAATSATSRTGFARNDSGCGAVA